MYRSLLAIFLLVASLQILFAAAPSAPAPMPEPARSLYAILFHRGPAWRKGLPMEQQELRPHGQYYRDLLKAGRVHAAGPLGESDGLALVWASDDVEAQTILRNDPAIATGILVGNVRLWRPRFRSPLPLHAQ